MASPETLAHLRALVAQVGPPLVVVTSRCVPTGHPCLDAHRVGWPAPGVVEIQGAVGSGRLSLLLPGVGERTRRGEVVGVVDPLSMVHPPGWEGVDLSRLLVVRPPPERAAWVAEQLAASGAVGLVLLLDPPRLGRAGPRIAKAADRGGATVVVVAESGEGTLPASVRLEVRGGRVRVLRMRGRAGGLEFDLPGLGPPPSPPLAAPFLVRQPG
jgi:hypothetical protein